MNGIGFPAILFLIFLVMKLMGFIAWSWWWIFAPLWVQFLLIFVLTFIAEMQKAKRDPWRQ